MALLAPVLAAMPPRHRPSLAERVRAVLFPAEDPGYIPLVGSPPLSFGPESPAAPGIRPAPIVLYAPPPRVVAPVANPTEPTAVPLPPEANSAPKTTPPPAAVEVKPEDVLPYFQLDDGTVRNADTLHFTPALPSSRADYRQQ